MIIFVLFLPERTQNLYPGLFPDLFLQLLISSVTPEQVHFQLSRFNANKSTGPDNCHPYDLFNFCDGLVIPLTMLFNKSLGEATLPDSWKDANSMSIFKKGCRTKPNNYRPVSLTSVICKMLETIIKTHLMDHLESNHLVQYEFHSGKLINF